MEDKPQPLTMHLEELRKRIIYCLITVVLVAVITYSCSQQLLTIIAKPIGKLVFITPIELFFAHLKLSLFASIFLSAPILLYHIWQFIACALTIKEKKFIIILLPLSLGLFISGSLFAYFLVVPLGIKFLLSFATESITPMISVSKYISFVGTFLLIFGILFELPLALSTLASFNIITTDFLKRNRKSAIVLTFIISALLTPPDVFTQILLAIPILILYEISIICAKIIKPKK